MKKLITCFVAVLLSTTTWAQKDKEEDDLVYRLDHKTTDGYAIKSTVDLSKGLNYWLITDQEQFDSMFEPSKEPGAKADKLDFNTQYVFAIAAPETRYQTYLAYKKVEVVNEKDVKVHCIMMEDYKKNFKYVPVLIGYVPKTPFVKNIVFCDEYGKEDRKYSLNKIDKEKQRIADKQIKAEKEAAEKEEKEAKAAAAKAEKEKRQAAEEKAKAEKAAAEARQEKEYEEQIAKEKEERKKQKEQEAQERREKEEREYKLQLAKEEKEARQAAEIEAREALEMKAREAEIEKERAEKEKEKEEARKEREKRKKERKAARETEEEEE